MPCSIESELRDHLLLVECPSQSAQRQHEQAGQCDTHDYPVVPEKNAGTRSGQHDGKNRQMTGATQHRQYPPTGNR